MPFESRFVVCQVMAIGALFSFITTAHSATDQQIRNAILERVAPDATTLSGMDANKDGKVDIADLVKTGLTPVATFDVASSSFTEGQGQATVAVAFDRPYTGTLKYSVYDMVAQTTTQASIPVDGNNAAIRIEIPDDGIATIAKVFQISIDDAPNGAYVPGASILHTLTVGDNDSAWEGVYVLDGISGRFRLEVIQNGGSRSATLVGDGFGSIPRRDCDTAATSDVSAFRWSATSFTLTTSIFSAEIEPIKGCLSAGTGVPTDLSRSLSFHEVKIDSPSADSGAAPTIEGTLTEELSWPSAPHLNRQVTGTYTLVKSLTPVTLPPPKLSAVP